MKYILFDQMEQCTELEVQRLLDVVSLQRRERALKYRFLSDQYACLKSYELLLKLLRECGVYLNGKPNFMYNEHNKPMLTDFPEIHFSISHCKKAILVAVSDHPVGVDVEAIRPVSEALIRRTMNECEAKEILSAAHPEIRFAEYWTKKEAVVKLRGTGIITNLQTILTSDVNVDTQVVADKGYVFSILF